MAASKSVWGAKKWGRGKGDISSGVKGYFGNMNNYGALDWDTRGGLRFVGELGRVAGSWPYPVWMWNQWKYPFHVAITKQIKCSVQQPPRAPLGYSISLALSAAQQFLAPFFFFRFEVWSSNFLYTAKMLL